MNVRPDLIDGYLVESELGRGGFGMVFEARSDATGEVVAVKVLRSISGKDDVRRAKRFRREIEVVGNLDHPRIIGAIDHGELEGGTLWYAMERLHGLDLADTLASERLTVGEASRITSQCLEALAAAHEADIVHRDVKPANIFLREDPDDAEAEPEVVLLDFGIAVLPGSERITRTGRIVGTPKYMAPESAQKAEYLPASDIYSLGIVFLEMLTGAPVFGGEAYEILLAHAIRDPEVPAELEGTKLHLWLRRATAKLPEDRFADAGAALEVLRTAIADIDDLASTVVSVDESESSSDDSASQQVVLTPADRAAIARAATLSSSSSLGELEESVSQIVGVDALAETGWLDAEETPRLVVASPDGGPIDGTGETQPMGEESAPEWLQQGVGVQGEDEVPTEPIPEDIEERAARGDFDSTPSDDEVAAAIDEGADGGEVERSPLLSPAARMAAALTVVFVGLMASLGLIRSQRTLEGGVWAGEVRFRVESQPAGANVEVDGAHAGRTPAVVSRPESDFPLVLVLRHSNGATKSKVVELPVSVVSLKLPPPRTRPDRVGDESERGAEDVEWVSEEDVDRRRGSGGVSSEELDRLFGEHVPVNKELILAGGFSPARPTPPPSSGASWLELRAEVTELAMNCMSPDRLDPPDAGGALPPQLVLELELRLSPGGVVRDSRAAPVRGKPYPDGPTLECIHAELRGEKLTRPSREAGNEFRTLVLL